MAKLVEQIAPYRTKSAQTYVEQSAKCMADAWEQRYGAQSALSQARMLARQYPQDWGRSKWQRRAIEMLEERTRCSC